MVHVHAYWSPSIVFTPFKIVRKYTSPRNEFEQFCERYTCFFFRTKTLGVLVFVYVSLKLPVVPPYATKRTVRIYQLVGPFYLRFILAALNTTCIHCQECKTNRFSFGSFDFFLGAYSLRHRSRLLPCVRIQDVFATTFGRRTFLIFDWIYYVTRRRRRV